MTGREYRDRVEAVAATMRAAEAYEDDAVWRALRWLAVAGVVVMVALAVLL